MFEKRIGNAFEIFSFFRFPKVEIRFDSGNDMRKFRRLRFFHSVILCAIFQLFSSGFSVLSFVVWRGERSEAIPFFFFFVRLHWISSLRLDISYIDIHIAAPLYGVINVFVGICVYDLVSYHFFAAPFRLNFSKITMNSMNLLPALVHRTYRLGCVSFCFILLCDGKCHYRLWWRIFDLLWLWLGALFL